MCRSGRASRCSSSTAGCYEYQVKQLEAQLAKAKQNVLVMKADIEVAAQKVNKLKSHLEFAKYQQALSANLAKQGAGPEEDAQKWAAQVAADVAAIKEAQAEEQRAILNYTSEINGVNTSVAAVQAELDQARFYLDNTLMVAPEDGYIINLQARPGMVAGDCASAPSRLSSAMPTATCWPSSSRRT
jgi:multidrug resistance efflux pump